MLVDFASLQALAGADGGGGAPMPADWMSLNKSLKARAKKPAKAARVRILMKKPAAECGRGVNGAEAAGISFFCCGAEAQALQGLP